MATTLCTWLCCVHSWGKSNSPTLSILQTTLSSSIQYFLIAFPTMHDCPRWFCGYVGWCIPRFSCQYVRMWYPNFWLGYWEVSWTKTVFSPPNDFPGGSWWGVCGHMRAHHLYNRCWHCSVWIVAKHKRYYNDWLCHQCYSLAIPLVNWWDQRRRERA